MVAYKACNTSDKNFHYRCMFTTIQKILKKYINTLKKNNDKVIIMTAIQVTN